VRLACDLGDINDDTVSTEVGQRGLVGERVGVELDAPLEHPKQHRRELRALALLAAARDAAQIEEPRRLLVVPVSRRAQKPGERAPRGGA